MMTESLPAIASAVIIPETVADQSPISPSRSATKRRPSQLSEEEGGSKRPRLSEHDNENESKTSERKDEPNHDSANDPPSPNQNDGTTTSADKANDTEDPKLSTAERRRNGQMEERKRSKRLFGALIGTLSQSSSKNSLAQRRRAEIEQKQQVKLKVQAEELDQERLKRLEVVMRVRRKEQRKFDEQSMRIKHSNQLAMANFLYTSTEPRLYYRPLELFPEEEDRIKAQIDDAEAFIGREEDEFYQTKVEEPGDRAHHDDDHERPNNTTAPEEQSQQLQNDTKEEPQASTSSDKVTNDAHNTDTDMKDGAVEGKRTEHEDDEVEDKGEEEKVRDENRKRDEFEFEAKKKEAEAENAKDNADDPGDEMMEAGEDAVIY